MMSAQIARQVGHRIPLIRFTHGLNKVSANQTTTPAAASPSHSVQATPQMASSNSTNPLEFFETPRRFQRRPIAESEINAINGGGL